LKETQKILEKSLKKVLTAAVPWCILFA